MKTLRLKAALIILIALLIISFSLNLMSERIIFAKEDKPSWGKLYTSSDQKYICACDPTDECTPCLTIPD